MSTESIKEDSEEKHIFDDFNESSNCLINPIVNEILMAFPFLRNVPGTYKNGYQAVLDAKRKLIEKFFHEIKVTFTSISKITWFLYQLIIRIQYESGFRFVRRCTC